MLAVCCALLPTSELEEDAGDGGVATDIVRVVEVVGSLCVEVNALDVVDEVLLLVEAEDVVVDEEVEVGVVDLSGGFVSIAEQSGSYAANFG
mmetsp:Transcript_16189/g.50677  ORF Transcript_16189/g.50677 Transcript_16189/m.50677 type:complete len:92 (+) Transcript_16189:2762-3037(+)